MRIPVGLLLCVMILPVLRADAGQGEEAAIAGEASRLVAALDGLWPEIDCRLEEGDLAPSAPVGLLARAVRGGSADRIEAVIAGRVMAAWRRCLSRALPAPPAFEDARQPAPEAWVRKALPPLVAREADLLAQALEAPKAGSARRLAARAAAARFRRVAMLPPEVIARRRIDEREQGLALYAAYHALLRARHDNPAGTPEDFTYTLAPGLRDTLLEELRQAAAGRQAAFTPEVAGFAQALLLDRIRHGWRAELRRGLWRSLDQLLVQPVRPFGNQGQEPEVGSEASDPTVPGWEAQR